MINHLLAVCGIGALVGFALAAGRSRRFSGAAFSLWVLAFVLASLVYPAPFVSWRGYPLTNLIVPLIQIIMFGMGTTLSVADFRRVFRMPRAALAGIVLQFLVMPLAGWTLARAFGLEGAVAAGVVLVGAAPGGVASNVMAYLAGGNVALSVTMTACSTLVSPILTPLAMTTLAGAFVPISFTDMMWSIVRMIILPIVAGLVVNRFLPARSAGRDRALAFVSMTAICIVLAIITASARDQLLAMAFSIVFVVVLHNGIGFTLGYWGARLIGLSESDARTVSIEVGLQNAGMASGLAISVLKNAASGLAPAVFGVYMNLSGSLLASWWRGRDQASASAGRR